MLLLWAEVPVVEHHHHGDWKKVPDKPTHHANYQHVQVVDLRVAIQIKEASQHVRDTEDTHDEVKRLDLFVKDSLGCLALITLLPLQLQAADEVVGAKNGEAEHGEAAARCDLVRFFNKVLPLLNIQIELSEPHNNHGGCCEGAEND